jgi:hypothetical protein
MPLEVSAARSRSSPAIFITIAFATSCFAFFLYPPNVRWKQNSY